MVEREMVEREMVEREMGAREIGRGWFSPDGFRQLLLPSQSRRVISAPICAHAVFRAPLGRSSRCICSLSSGFINLPHCLESIGL